MVPSLQFGVSTEFSPMTEIVPERLWIGNLQQARDVTSVLNRGIRAIVDLALEELPVSFPRDFTYLRIPLLDGPDNTRSQLELAVSAVATLIAAGVPLLVVCGAGLSRSPAVVAAAWSRVHSVPLVDALRAILIHGPHDVSPGLWADLQRHSSAPA